MVSSINPNNKQNMMDILTRLDNITSGNITKISNSNVILTEDNLLDPSFNKSLNKQAMAKTLNNLNKIFEGLKEDSSPEFNLAIQTKKIHNGVTIAGWDIIEENNRFSISHNNEIIIENFRNYNSAKCLVKLMESGKRMNNSIILEIMGLENKYSHIYNEALLYKKYLRKNLTESKRDYYEIRFEDTKSQLQDIKTKLFDIDSNIA